MLPCKDANEQCNCYPAIEEKETLSITSLAVLDLKMCCTGSVHNEVLTNYQLKIICMDNELHTFIHNLRELEVTFSACAQVPVR